MMKNLLDACGAAIGFFTVGFAFGFGGQDFTTKTTFIGTTNFFMMNVDDMAYWLFEFAFAATSATIVAGTLAERCQMAAYLCYSFFLTAFVYPVVAHAIWSNNGFLSAFNVDPFLGVGMVDFAGSGVVHLTGGTTAVFATMILGPRKGRFYDARGNPLHVPKPFPGHSIALQVSRGSHYLLHLPRSESWYKSDQFLDNCILDAGDLYSLVRLVWIQSRFSFDFNPYSEYRRYCCPCGCQHNPQCCRRWCNCFVH
jgi:hypothetical protein